MGRSQRAPTRTLLPALLLALACASLASGDLEPGYVGFAEASFVQTQFAGTYASVADVVYNGTVLAGSGDAAVSFEACAIKCTRNITCSGFNWCDKEASCLAGASGGPLAYQECQLVFQEALQPAGGVLVLRQSGAPAGSLPLGTAGVWIRGNLSASFEGYMQFSAVSFYNEYDLDCNGTRPCVATEELQESVNRCTAWPECQAVVVSMNQTRTYQVFKGTGNGSLLDPGSGTLAPQAYSLIEESALPEQYLQSSTSAEDGTAGEGGALSAGAIAGIVVGLVAAGAGLVLAGRLLFRRCRLRRAGPGAQGTKGQPAGPIASITAEDVAAVWGKEGSEACSDANEMLVAQLLSEAPSPQWAAAVVRPSNIQFVTQNGRAVRLGGGASGTVYQGLLNSATPCALKVFDFSGPCSLPRDFIQEAMILRRLSHPYIVQFLGVSVTEGRGVLLMELVGGGDLWRALRADQPARGGERQWGWYRRGRQVALQVASGLLYLHQQQIVYLDLKSPNILLSKEGTAKIGDVGFSRMLHTSHVSSLGGKIGTWSWCAPELLLGGRASQKADIYSFGVLLWELCTGEEPQRGFMEPLSAPRHCPAQVAELQARCLAQEPQDRPSAEEIVAALKQAVLIGPASLPQRPSARQVELATSPSSAPAAAGGEPQQQAQHVQQQQQRAGADSCSAVAVADGCGPGPQAVGGLLQRAGGAGTWNGSSQGAAAGAEVGQPAPTPAAAAAAASAAHIGALSPSAVSLFQPLSDASSGGGTAGGGGQLAAGCGVVGPAEGMVTQKGVLVEGQVAATPPSPFAQQAQQPGGNKGGDAPEGLVVRKAIMIEGQVAPTAKSPFAS